MERKEVPCNLGLLPAEVIDYIACYLKLRDWIRFTQLTTRKLSEIPYEHQDVLCKLSQDVARYKDTPILACHGRRRLDLSV